jgi:hypothetical protein
MQQLAQPAATRLMSQLPRLFNTVQVLEKHLLLLESVCKGAPQLAGHILLDTRFFVQWCAVAIVLRCAKVVSPAVGSCSCLCLQEKTKRDGSVRCNWGAGLSGAVLCSVSCYVQEGWCSRCRQLRMLVHAEGCGWMVLTAVVLTAQDKCSVSQVANSQRNRRDLYSKPG